MILISLLSNVATCLFAQGPGSGNSPGKPNDPTADRIKPTGESIDSDGSKTSFEYAAKYVGKNYPVSGSDLYDPIALKRLNDHTVESTPKKVPAHRPVLFTQMCAKRIFAGLALFARIALVFEGTMSHAQTRAPLAVPVVVNVASFAGDSVSFGERLAIFGLRLATTVGPRLQFDLGDRHCRRFEVTVLAGS